MRRLRIKRVALCAAIALALLAGCRGEDESGGGPGGPPRGGPGGFGGGGGVTVSVETTVVERGEFRVTGSYAGEFQSDGMAQLSADVAGRVLTVDANIGDEVADGQVLATIDDTNFRQAVRELDAAVQVSRASLEESRVNLENLQADLRRRRPLLDRQMVTEREIEELESSVRRAEQQMAVAQATIEQNQARLTSAREDLRNAQIRAPFAGQIGERYIDRGSWVSPGQPAFTVIDGGELYLSVRLPERDAPRVHLDTPVQIRVGAMGSAPYSGRIHRIAPAMDPTTRSLRVDVLLDEGQDIFIRPGMFARVQLELGRHEDAVTIGNQAILRRTDGTPYAWLVEDGKATRRELTLGLMGQDRTQILEGLSAGDQVVFRGHEKLEEGTGIRDISPNAAREAARTENE